jgi:hypothetical protein
VTKPEVLEIVDNYHRGQIENQANQDPLEQGETRQVPRENIDQSSADTEESTDKSLFGRIKGAVTDNVEGSKGKRNIAHGAVAGTLTAGAIAATVLSGGTAVPAAAAASVAASTVAPGLRASAADAVSPEDEVPLNDQQLEQIAEKVEKVRDDVNGQTTDDATDLRG